MGKFSTLLGILISIALIAWSILSGGDPTAYVDVPSIAVVVGGTVGTTLMVFSIAKLKSLVKIFKIAFFQHPKLVPLQTSKLHSSKDSSSQSSSPGVTFFEPPGDFNTSHMISTVVLTYTAFFLGR